MANADGLTEGTEKGLEHKRCFPQFPDETTERSPAPGGTRFESSRLLSLLCSVNHRECSRVK